MNDKLIRAIHDIANLSNEEKTNIKGKFYTTVDKRLQTFRTHFGTDARISTEVIHHDLERVVVKATVHTYENGEWREIGNDYAEEFRGSGMVNKTSALENCCTSAIGRALASCGLGGGEYASSFEVDNAINNKAEAPKIKYKLLSSENNKAPLTSAYDEKGLLNACRRLMNDPNDEDHIKLYEVNKKVINEARSNCDDNDLYDSFTTLISLYEVQ